jgi:DNA-binding PucR family transcriptional regulator
MVSVKPSKDAGAVAAALLERFPAATALAVADPQDPGAPLAPGELVLGVGIGPAGAAELLASARAGRAAGVLLRRPRGTERAGADQAGADQHGADQPSADRNAADQGAIERLAAAEGVPLGWVEARHGWNELHRQLLDRLAPPAIRADDELGELAQTIATLTGGLVTIEDTSSRVLAYSRSADDVDELRRLSILGRSGPAPYLALLRQWGVYDRLASSEEVVEIAEHPESGVRRRLAVGVFAGDRQLATIWLQQGSGNFEPHAEQALLGAARITAAQLVSRGRRPAGSGTELAALLGTGQPGTGQPSTAQPSTGQPGTGQEVGAALQVRLGRAVRQPCAVAVVELGPDLRDAAGAGSQLDELAAILTVHAAAYRRAALVEQLAGRVYLLLPALEPAPPGRTASTRVPSDRTSDSGTPGTVTPGRVAPGGLASSGVTSATAMLRQAMAAVRRHLDPAARAAIGPVVESVPAAARSRHGAELALGVAGNEPVSSFDEVRPRLLIRAIEDCLHQHDDLLDPRVASLVRTDPDGAWTLLNYLEAGSDVGRVARQLHLHPTTVRYRLRRATQAAGIDISGGPARFAVHAQLRCGLRPELSEG